MVVVTHHPCVILSCLGRLLGLQGGLGLWDPGSCDHSMLSKRMPFVGLQAHGSWLTAALLCTRRRLRKYEE